MAEDLIIHAPLGVSDAITATRILAEVAGKQGKQRVLDMGTGTGYIAIYLAKLGMKADATDISDLALETATSNASENNVHINIYKSNYFENVKSKFDLIVWNAPVGDSHGSKSFDFLKSMIRKIPILRKLVQKVTYKLYLEERLNMDKIVLGKVSGFLESRGVLVMILIDGEKEELLPLAQEAGFISEVIDAPEFRKSVPGCIALFTKKK